MILVPTNKVLATVAKLDAQDPVAARTFLQFALYESMCDQAEAARVEVEPYVLAKMVDTLETARRTMLRNHIGKSIDANGNSEDLPYAQGIAVLETHIEKSLSGIMATIFNRKHPRGEGGRWIHANVSAGTTASLTPMEAQDSLHNTAEDKANGWKSQGFITDTTPITMQHRKHGAGGNPVSGSSGVVETTTTVGRLRNDARRLEDNEAGKYKLEGISVTNANKPPAANAKTRVALDIMAAAMGGDKGMGRRLTSGLPMDRDTGENKPQDQNAAEWNRISSAGDRQSYRRMSMTGDLLSRISAPGSTLDTVGGLAQLVGQMGPEAEKVLGPGVRRTAYRYRGTERRPDRALVKGVNEATAAANSLDANKHDESPGAAERNMRSIGAGRSLITGEATRHGGLAVGRGERSAPSSDADPVAMTNHYWMDEKVSEDFRTLGMRGDAAVVNMLDLLPDKVLTELAVESGEIPPSQGVIINAAGKVVTQAVGYNGDHYLPFDLKNLNALHGGQYVRTRAAGGPTTEDLYTGLLSGARQIQVVSNSGVFTVEFDPDLRGGRRYSDKAGRMISRYGKLLETVVAGNIWQTDLPPEKLEELKQNALKSSMGDPTTYREHLNILRNRERLASSIAGEDDDTVLEEAANNHALRAAVKEAQTRKIQRIQPMSTSERAHVMDTARRRYEIENKNMGARPLRLDGPGYERALKTLRQEFPYFIRQAKWQSLPDYLKVRGIQNKTEFRHFYPADQGHVAPGQVHFKQHQVPQHAGAAAPTAREVPGVPPAAAREVAGAAPVAPVSVASQARFVREMAKTVSGALSSLFLHTPDGKLPVPPEGKTFAERDAMAASEYTPAQFAKYKLETLENEVGPSGTATAFTRWLLNTAPESQRNKIVAALPEVKSLSEDDPDAEEINRAGVRLASLLDAVFPFAPASDGDPVVASPGERSPKPQRFPDIPTTVGAEAYDTFLAGAVVTDPAFAAAVGELRAMPLLEDGKFDDDAAANQIVEALDAYEGEPTESGKPPLLAALTAHQKAWSFIKARHAAIVLAKIGGTPSDADPFAFSGPVGKAVRRKVVVHKVNDPFSQRVRIALRKALEESR